MSDRYDSDLPEFLRENLPTPEEFLKAFRKARGSDHAVLDESGNVHPIEVYDEEGNLNQAKLIEWAMWFEKEHTRKIAYIEIAGHRVSTIFLGLNLADGLERPLWFETIVFGPPRIENIGPKRMSLRPELWGKRTSTRAEALESHAEGIEWLKKHLAGRRIQFAGIDYEDEFDAQSEKD